MVLPMSQTREFNFGQNWKRFVHAYFNEDRRGFAQKSLTQFLCIENLHDKTFVDVGCGSGLFSLAANDMGAKKVVSFDISELSVECCMRLRALVENPANWEVCRGSVLDETFMKKLGTFDIVYSWGALHHTGKMWTAIKNASELVAPGGLFLLAVYNRVDQFGLFPDGRFGTSKFWEREKKFYVRMPPMIQRIFDGTVAAALIFSYLVTFKNPVKKINQFKNLYRGMSWIVDIRDWLGGYPYEYASIDEIFHFMKKSGFTLENLLPNTGFGNNQYLFRRTT
jgi:2-polyprenyl-6-hydroxyphenyl methylase/3-demethylubiquinone-9 3-methyltransferase